MLMKVIDFSRYHDVLKKTRRAWHKNYYAMYSSVLDCVVTDPLMMQVPVDDHLVHRGDGVFDMFKCVQRGAFQMEAHLERLINSAHAIGLEWRSGLDSVRSVVMDVLRTVNKDDCSVKLMISRGPGSFTANPFDCPQAQLYILVYALALPFMKRHPQGAVVRRSSIQVKEPRFATTKTCNYLPNAMMKYEAHEMGVDFVVAFDTDGHMAEGGTENFGIISKDGDLLFPKLDRILRGITMTRVMELAKQLVAEGKLRSVGFHDITQKDIDKAREMIITGTTIDVVSVRRYEEKEFPACTKDSIAPQLNQMLEHDIYNDSSLRTAY